MTEQEPSNNEPQNPFPSERPQISPWAPEFVAGSEPAAHAAGSAVVSENVRWDQPEKPVIREAGEFSKKEIKQVGDVYKMLQRAMAPPEPSAVSIQPNPTDAKQYLDSRLRTVELQLGRGQVSKNPFQISQNLFSNNATKASTIICRLVLR